MKYKYLAQDEYDVVDEYIVDDSKNIKDPIEIIIKITIDRKRYESVKNRRKTNLPEYIKDLFKPLK